jgi:hypothetical protein
MKCPICQSKLTYKVYERTKPSIPFYEVDCANKECRAADDEERLFFAFADNYPSKEITDYCITVSVDGNDYMIESVKEFQVATFIDKSGHLSNGNDSIKNLIILDEFYPLQDNIKFYQDLVRRVLKLKAFW